MPAEPTPLRQIGTLLRSAGLQIQISGAGPDIPLERLDVRLQQDDAGRDLVLSMLYVNDFALTDEALTGVMEDDATGGDDEDDETILLHLSVILPFSATDATATDSIALMMELNRILPAGAFGYSRPDHGLFLAYVLVLDSAESITGVTLNSLLQLFSFALEAYAPMIESVATGALSFAQVLSEIEQQGKMPPVGPPPVMGTGVQPDRDHQQALGLRQ